MSERALLSAVEARLGRDVASRLRALRRRLWLRRAVRAGAVWLPAGLLAAALVQLVARSMPLEAAPALHAGVALASVAGWAAHALLRRPGLVEAARRADDELGMRERLGTALELLRDPGAGERSPAAEELAERQLADTRTRLGLAEVRRAFGPRLDRRPSAITAVAAALLVVLVAWPNPQEGVLRDRAATRDAARDVAERVEEVADDAERRGAETPDPRRDRLVEELRRLARQLRDEADDRQAVVARIGAVAQELSRMTDPRAAERDAGLTSLARATSRAASGDQEANPEGDPERAAQDLESLAGELGGMDTERAAQRADAIRDAADSSGSAQPEVAGLLREAADAVERAARSGSEQDRRAASDALARAAAAFREASRDRELQRDVARAQSTLQEGARQVARAGQPQPGTGAQPGASDQPGAGQPGAAGSGAPRASGAPVGSGRPAPSGQPGQPGNQPGQPGNQPGQPGNQPGQPGNQPGQPGNQPGTQPGNQPGNGSQPGAGGGSTARRIPSGGPRTGGFDGPSQGNRDFSVEGLDDLFAPFDRIGRPGEPSFVAGQGSEGGEEQTGSSTGSGFDNDAVVPYRSVYDAFLGFANNQLDRAEVPITLKDLVRDYFTRLEPTE
ncbi:MAG TPA: hypothetical protein VHK06_06150 [Candidatus Limnocylindria bacterium]|nr:hypothetical protein [Candidatus Limnocylindria bacterium]